MDSDPPRSARHPTGYDEADPYKEEDLSTYPDWWQSAIELFRAHGMRPYRPPRFIDGQLVPEVVPSLEDEFGIKIQLRSASPTVEDTWAVYVNGDPIFDVERYREGNGYSIYEITSDHFREEIVDYLD